MNSFKNNTINIYGTIGKQWLTNLPKLLKKIEAEYGLVDLKPINNLSYNYVLSGFQNDQPIILKLGLDIDGIKREAAALHAFSRYGSAKVLAENDGILLLERAIPGTSLKSYFPSREDEAIQITCEVIKKLHQARPESEKFPHIKDWLKILDKEWKIPIHYLKKARILRDQLLRTSEKPVLLHGDLHHDNILKNNTDWLVIDPKGVIGEPIYEVAAFIRNPIPELLTSQDVINIISHRINIFDKTLNLNHERIKQWCFVQAILGWIWALEDGCDESYFKRLVEVFYKL